MESLELLRQLLEGTDARVTDDARGRCLPGELRYVLEYPAVPDAAAQAVAVAALLRSNAFELEPPASGQPDRFLILRFPDIERALPQRDMFALGYALADALRLVSAEPDLGADVGRPRHDGATGLTSTSDGTDVRSIRVLLDEEIGPGPDDTTFPWARFEAEIATIARAQARLGASIATLTAEAKVATTRPSPQLAAAAAASADMRLARFSEHPGQTGVSRPPAHGAASAEPRLVKLAMPKSAGLESAGGIFDLGKAREYLQGKGRTDQLDRLEGILQAQAHPDRALRLQTIDNVDEALGAIARGEPLSVGARVGLETLVRLNGRPALRIRNGAIDLGDPRAREWHDRLFLLLQDPRFQERAKSVGRIDVDGVHVGTGFVVGDGRVLTNRHVLQTFAAPVPRRNNPRRWVLTDDKVTIDFADEPSSATSASRFRVKGVIGAGPSDIQEDLVDFTDLDAALLDVEVQNGAGTPLPSPIQLVADKTKADRHRNVLVVGYPARPATLPLTETGDIDVAVAKRLSVLFGSDYGSKYVSPGEIDRAIGGLPADTRQWTVTHDATTLGGSSGSCIIGFDEPVAAIGLHFGGDWMRENYAHVVAALARDGNFLTDPALRWIP